MLALFVSAAAAPAQTLPAGLEAFGEEVESPQVFEDLADTTRNYSDDRPGFMIVTTNDLTHRLESLQAYITHKSEHAGFRVFLTTESDWAGQSEAGRRAQERGAFPGRVRGHDILTYLKENYERLGIEYVLFIGDSRADQGTVPMLRVRHHKDFKNHYRNEGEPYDDIEAYVRDHLTDANNHYIEYAEVISDYPYVDLGTDWDANQTGFFDAQHDPNPDATLEPEVYVGRIPYYGESSRWGKASDIDTILQRIIRYDTEEDIAWRYNLPYHVGKNEPHAAFRDRLNEHGVNVSYFVEGEDSFYVGMPPIAGPDGRRSITNFDVIQRIGGIGYMNTWSHGGPHGMNGLRSGQLAEQGHDRFPSVLSLGACDIGQIHQPENLVYTLLRFHSVSVSGGTGSVTSYGGDGQYTVDNRLTRHDLMLDGHSAGHAHWEWYGALYRNTRIVPMTALKINIYGDPSVVPLRHGPTPPFPFLARPVEGIYQTASHTRPRPIRGLVYPDVLELENPGDQAMPVSVTTSVPWLKAERDTLELPASSRVEIRVGVDPRAMDQLTPGLNEGTVRLTDASGFICERRYVVYMPAEGINTIYSFEGGGNQVFNQMQRYNRHGHHASLPREDQATGPRYVEGLFGQALNTRYPLNAEFQAFNREDFSIFAQFRLDAEAVQAAAQRPVRLMSASHRSFTLERTAEGLRLWIAPHGKHPHGEVRLDAEVDWPADEWAQVGFGIDQDQGKVSLYFNGRPVADTDIEPEQFYGGSSLHVGGFAGAMDDLVVYTGPIGPRELARLRRGRYVAAIGPADDASAVPADSVEFECFVGAGVEEPRVVYQAIQGSSRREQIQPDEQGRFIAHGLESNATYRWHIEGRGGRSTPRTFRTVEQLIHSPNPTNSIEGWEGQYRHEPIPTGMVLTPAPVATTLATQPLEANCGYRLSAKTITRGGHYLAQVYYMDSDDEEVILAESTGHGDLELEFFSLADGPQVGKRPMIRFLQHNARWVNLIRVSFHTIDASEVNFKPEVQPALAELDAQTTVGYVGYQFSLSELVVDPEGQPLDFAIVSGPDWAYVQEGNTFFSNYGPEPQHVGENTFRLQATDPGGRQIEFELTIRVRS